MAVGHASVLIHSGLNYHAGSTVRSCDGGANSSWAVHVYTNTRRPEQPLGIINWVGAARSTC